MCPTSCKPSSVSARRPSMQRSLAQCGFSLIELMVGLAIGLIVVAGILQLIANMGASRAAIDRTGRQIENGRFAIQKLTEDLRHTGFFGEFSDLPLPSSLTPALLSTPCSVDPANLTAMMSIPVRPYTAADAATRPACIDAADFVADTNVLVLRFASPVVTPVASLDANTMYTQGIVGSVIVAAGTAGNFTLTRHTALPGAPVPGDIRQYVTRMYFVSPCSRPAAGEMTCTAAADEGSPIPTLKMVELRSSGGGPAFTAARAIAEGVERFELDYGIDMNADGAADVFRRCTTGADACAVDDLLNIVTVNLYIVARDTERTPGFTDTKVYALGGAGNYTPDATAAKYRRHLYSGAARVNNLSMRKE